VATIAVDRLKVLFITNWYPTREAPAKAAWVREHARAAALFDDVAVLHCAGSDPGLKRRWRLEDETDEELAQGVPTYRIWYRSGTIRKLSYFRYASSIYGAYRQIVNRGFRPDIIHVQIYDAGAPALVIGKLTGVPVVVSEHFSSFPRRLLGRLDFFKAWIAFRGANMVLPVSGALRDAIQDYGIRARFQVIPNVVDTNVFFPAPHLRNPIGPKRLLFVGQLVPVRGLALLLDALSNLRRKRDDWRLDIVGGGGARMEYERRAADLKICDMLTFHGVKSKPQVAHLMRRADLFVLPSLVETFGVAAAEALACGIPVLATRCGGPQEFLGGDVASLVAPCDADALCRGLDQMLDNLHSYAVEALSRYARERFSPQVVGAKLHAVYESLSSGANAKIIA
jgi:glycosyltransferase involved in cell wall biosynthesis